MCSIGPYEVAVVRRSPSFPTAAPSEEKFPEEICSSPEQDRKSAARQGDFAESGKPVLRQRKNESAQIFPGTLDLHGMKILEPPGFQKGRVPFVEAAPQCSYPRQLLLGGSTPLFFAQLRRMGSKKAVWQASARTKMAPGPRAGSCPKKSQSGFDSFSGSGNHVNIRGLFSTSLGSSPFASHQRKNALLRNGLRFCIAL